MTFTVRAWTERLPNGDVIQWGLPTLHRPPTRPITTVADLTPSHPLVTHRKETQA